MSSQATKINLAANGQVPGVDAEPTYTISELNQRVQAVLRRQFPGEIWVRGEIKGYDLKKDRQHVGFALIEKALDSDDIVAEVPVILYSTDREALEATLRQTENAFQLQDGLEVRFKVNVDLWVKAGRYQLPIRDIDPTFTLGRLAQNRAKIIESLKRNGLLDRNKSAHLPLVPLTLGVIGSKGSAGLNDFLTHIRQSGIAFRVHIVNTAMQGARVEPEVIQAINALNELTNLDVIIIVRGGGSDADLTWFDRLQLAETIARSSRPVITGLGHTHNLCIADMVAYINLKTPTDAAQFLVGRVEAFLQVISQLRDRIVRRGVELLDSTKRELQSQSRDLVSTTKYRLLQEHESVKGVQAQLAQHAKALLARDLGFIGDMERRLTVDRLRPLFKREREVAMQNRRRIAMRTLQVVSGEVQYLENARKSCSSVRLARVFIRETDHVGRTSAVIGRQTVARIRNEKVQLDATGKRISDLDPINTVRRGFSLTFDEKGHVVTSVKQLISNTEITTQLKDGIAASRVTRVTTREEGNG